jgi:hypothetical protein
MCDVSVKDATQLGLVQHQGLMSRVAKVCGPLVCPRVTTKLSHCWDYGTEVIMLSHNTVSYVVEDGIVRCYTDRGPVFQRIMLPPSLE